MPLYDYKCAKCEKEWEDFNYLHDRTNAYCCDTRAELVIKPTRTKPIIHEYFSENLNTLITGPAQKKRVMKKLNMEEN